MVIMRNLIYFFVLMLMVMSCGKTDPMQEVISKSFDVVEQQAVAMAEYLDDKEGRLPRSYGRGG
jgi:hypothetical protein